MKSFVTGGAGFIGSHVVRALLGRGDEVRVLTLPGEDVRNLEGLDVERWPGDVTDADAMREAVRGCERVFHLAAIYALWLPDPRLMRRVNVGGTRNVLQAAADAGVATVVHTSSIACFGGQGRGADATEESSFALGSTGDLYSLTKHEAHEVALSFAREGLDVRVAAPCGPIGPGDVGPTPTGRLLLAAVQMPVLVVTDTAANLVDVRDVAEGQVRIAERGEPGESYLLGCRNLTFAELADLAFEALGVRKPVLRVPRAAEMAAAEAALAYTQNVSRRPPLITPAAVRIARLGLRADCRKAVEELGLPQTPLAESVRDALAWFARQGYVRDDRTARRLRRQEAARAGADGRGGRRAGL